MTLLQCILIFNVWTSLTGGTVQFESQLCKICECRSKEGLTGIIVDCSSRSLKEIPPNVPENTTWLILQDNLIENITDYTFNGSKLSFLDISNNRITRLNRFSFFGLDTLITLDLHSNNINMEPENYPIGVFNSLVNLQTLDISSNNAGSIVEYPNESFSTLWSLETLKLDGLPGITLGKGFSNLTNLKFLNFTGNCNTQNITNNSFTNVPNIEILVLSNCQITQIDSFAFSMFSKLQFLDLSGNRKLGFDAATLPLKNLNSAAFRILNISCIYETFGLGTEVTSDQVYRFKHLNITELYLDHNRIQLFEDGVPYNLSSTIKIVSITDNIPIFGTYMLEFNVLKNIICIDASYQYFSHLPMTPVYESCDIIPDRHYFHNNCPYFNETIIHHLSNKHPHDDSDLIEDQVSDTDTHISLLSWLTKSEEERDQYIIGVSPNIQYINVSHMKLGCTIPRMTFATNRVKILDFSSNIVNKWHGPILGITSLEWLSLSNNFCDEINEDFFKGSINLLSLYIGSNFLSFTFASDISGSIFKPLSKLEILDISDNQITVLPSVFLHAQIKLKYLDLSNNRMKQWTLDIDHMNYLTFIDLGNNSLSTLPLSLRKFGDLQKAKGTILTINLLGQTLLCTCQNLDFLKWMETNTTNFVRRNEYTCENLHGKMIQLNDLKAIVLNLEKECASWTVMIVVLTSSMAIIITVMVSSVIYRYRWKLRYLYYVRRNKYRQYAALANDLDNQFDFNAFISYADEDRRIVVTDMIEKLETQQGMQLCIHHRDFLVGEVIAANISNAVRNSKKTLILLTKNFLKSYWCIYELNMALMESISTGRNVVIVIIYEHIPVKDLPHELIQLMRKDSYVEYTDDPEGNIVFWDSLTKAINAD
ncbi:toll-like receptor 4 [Patella vulgata]|uniref:toll-like receptor 4 n=1 Tax=Patella vulgata TaxID=6465 RepID=UPI00218049E7|nr:toll-like receptor 4 [Patella vulgata]